MSVWIYFLIGGIVLSALILHPVWQSLLRRSVPSVRSTLIFGALVLSGFGYLVEKWTPGQGPDDDGAMSYADISIFHQRPSSWRIVRMMRYQKDPAQPSSGDYWFKYEAGDHAGSIVCHYEGTSGRFSLVKIEDVK